MLAIRHKHFARILQFGWTQVAPLLLLLVALLSAYLFLQLTDEVTEGETQSFDEWALRSLRRPDSPAVPIGPPWLREVGFDATALGSPFVLLLVVASATGFMLLQQQYALTLLTIVSTAGGSLATLVLKHLIGRERPTVVPHLQEVTTPSFPSGHAMLAAVVYLTVGSLLMGVVQGRLTKAYCLLCAMFIALLVGLSRVYLGVHYPTDVLAGWMAGVVWALACWFVAQYLQRRRINEHRLQSESPTVEGQCQRWN